MNFDLESTLLSDDIATAAASKKDSLLERLNKRNKDRQTGLDQQLEQRNKQALQREGIDYFAHSFTERVREIETRITNISEAAAAAAAAKQPPPHAEAQPAVNDLPQLFADITLELQELQRYLTTSTMFLTDFKIKACQNVLNELIARAEETRLRLLPKKKFGFRGKKVAPKVVVNPKLCAVDDDNIDAAAKSLSAAGGSAAFEWTLSNRVNEYICLRDDAVAGQDITISNLRNCFVELQGHAGSVQISHATGCTFLCGPIARSLFAEHCSDSTLALACQQLRLHSSAVCRIYLHVTCRAIIEDCTEIALSDYNYGYESIEQDFALAGLDKAQNNYRDVADFNWLSPDVHSPNWRVVEEDNVEHKPPNWSELRAAFEQQAATPAQK